MLTLRTYEMDVILRNELLLTTARRLTLYSTSGMNVALNRFMAEAPNRHINAKGIFAYKGELCVGWCLLTFESDGMEFTPATNKDACVQIFVDYNERRQGIGSAMLREATLFAHDCSIKCYHWDAPSFFKSFIEQSNYQAL